MSRQKSAYNYAFTLFNYTDLHVAQLKALPVKYILFGFEICPDTKRPHLQGYINLTKDKTLSALKKLIDINHIHLEIARKDSLANYDYCTKDNNFIEVGQRPISKRDQGKMEKERWLQAKLHAQNGDIGKKAPIYLPAGVWKHIMEYADERPILEKERNTYRNANDDKKYTISLLTAENQTLHENQRLLIDLLIINNIFV